MTATKYQWLDLLRGASALLVCANHLRAAMFVDHSALSASSAGVKLFYFVTGLGAQAVIVFFVLSGFFVGGSVLKRRTSFSFPVYLLTRLTRLWVVLLPALLLTFLVDRITGTIAPGILSGQETAILNSGPAGDFDNSLRGFVRNLLFLQTITGPVYGSNGPLWSLANEFWYYLCFPLAYLVVANGRSAWVRVSAALSLGILGWLVLDNMLAGLLVWTLGAAAYCVPQRHRLARPLAPLAVAGALALFALALVLSKTGVLADSPGIALLGLASSGLIIALRTLPPMPRVLAAFTELLARCSYTLYLTHFPLVLLAYAGFFRGEQHAPGGGSYLLFAALLIALVGIAQLLWMLFEKHTERVKLFLLALGRKGGPHIVQS